MKQHVSPFRPQPPNRSTIARLPKRTKYIKPMNALASGAPESRDVERSTVTCHQTVTISFHSATGAHWKIKSNLFSPP